MVTGIQPLKQSLTILSLPSLKDTGITALGIKPSQRLQGPRVTILLVISKKSNSGRTHLTPLNKVRTLKAKPRTNTVAVAIDLSIFIHFWHTSSNFA